MFQSLVGERDEARQEGESERRRLTLENKLLKERIRLLLLSKHGSTSEQLSDAQLALLELEPGVTREEVATEAAQPAREKQLRRQSAPHGRSPLPAHLPRVVELIAVPQSQRHCATCGGVKCVIGHDLTEVLDLQPVELFVRVIQREKLACPRHPEAGVAMGPSPERIIPGGKFSAAFIIAAVLKKYLDHLPRYRQSEAWWRDARVAVSRSVLGDAIMAVGALRLPVNAAQRLELLARDYLPADATPVGGPNLGENAMRPIALGRKNWLHIGAKKAGPRSRRSCACWPRAADWESIRATICWPCCPSWAAPARETSST